MDDLRFDYGPVEWTFVSRILTENSMRLSRTRSGVSDTTTSPSKRPLRLSGEELRRRSACNEERVHQYIFSLRQEPDPQSPAEVRERLFAIADLTNEGLLPEGRLRCWPIGSGETAKLPPDRLPVALDNFCAEALHRWTDLHVDPLSVAGWAEWELNGGILHPFYDGCGRISRSFGAMLLLRAGACLPLYDTPESYFAAGNGGQEAFRDYLRRCVLRCADWLESQEPCSTAEAERERGRRCASP